MEEITFRVVEIDGELAEVRALFNGLATAVLDKPVECPDFEPPHTLRLMCEVAGLSSEEYREVRSAVAEIRDFWFSVPPVETKWRPVPRTDVIFHVNRCQTRGDPVIIQTIKWLMVHGYRNPIVWVEEA